MQGLVRRIDDLGRIVIPKEIRRSMGIKEGDPLGIETVPAGILLSPTKASCMICGNTKDLLEIDGIGVCSSCAQRLAEKLKENKPV